VTQESIFDKGNLKEVSPRAPVVYFLGAGFSVASCPKYPTSDGFLTRDKQILTDHEYLVKVLERIEAHHGPLEQVNLEDVMTDLEVRAFGLGHAWEDAEPQAGRENSLPTLRRDFEGLIRYITIRLRLLDQEPEEHTLAQRLLRSLKQQDSVITLNYDTIVERHLALVKESGTDRRVHHLGWTIGPPGSCYGGDRTALWKTFDSPEHGILAKLHGSVDWVTCPNPDCPDHSYISTIPGRDRSRPDIEPADARCTTCASGTQTVIIPPTAVKAFERFPKLRLMWLQSYHALRRAQRWVFIGVSFAPTDFHLSALIRSASSRAKYIGADSRGGQICVVNKDHNSAKEAAERLCRCLAPKVRSRIESGEDTIALFHSVDEYLDAAHATDGGRRDRTEGDGKP